MYTNIATYVYEAIETTRNLHLPDVTLGLAHLMSEKPVPEGVTGNELAKFLGRHYRAIILMFNGGSKEEFVDIVAGMAKDYLAPKEEADAE
jgi:hypothetical protein